MMVYEFYVGWIVAHVTLHQSVRWWWSLYITLSLKACQKKGQRLTYAHKRIINYYNVFNKNELSDKWQLDVKRWRTRFAAKWIRKCRPIFLPEVDGGIWRKRRLFSRLGNVSRIWRAFGSRYWREKTRQVKIESVLWMWKVNFLHPGSNFVIVYNSFAKFWDFWSPFLMVFDFPPQPVIELFDFLPHTV